METAGVMTANVGTGDIISGHAIRGEDLIAHRFQATRSYGEREDGTTNCTAGSPGAEVRQAGRSEADAKGQEPIVRDNGESRHLLMRLRGDTRATRITPSVRKDEGMRLCWVSTVHDYCKCSPLVAQGMGRHETTRLGPQFGLRAPILGKRHRHLPRMAREFRRLPVMGADVRLLAWPGDRPDRQRPCRRSRLLPGELSVGHAHRQPAQHRKVSMVVHRRSPTPFAIGRVREHRNPHGYDLGSLQKPEVSRVPFGTEIPTNIGPIQESFR